MSDERFEVLYDFQVRDERLDHTSQLLESINAHVARSSVALQQLERSSMGLGRIADRADRGRRSMLDLAGAAYVAKGAFDVMERVIGGAVGKLDAFGTRAIQYFGERTGTIRGYTTFLGGDRAQAELEYYRGQQFGQRTDFTNKTIEQGQSRLMAQGIRGHELYANLFSAADLAAASPDDKNETLKRVTMAMGQIKAKGKLQGEELTQQLAEAGLNTTLVKDEIRKALFAQTGKIQDVDQLMGKGKVSADVALPAIQRAILRQLGIKRAGEFATSSAGSVTSLISNKDEAFQNIMKSFDADKALPAMDRYKKALVDETSQFDVNTKRGKDLALVLQDVANATTNAKAGLSELTSSFLESFSDSYVTRLRRDGRDFNTELTTGALHNLGEAIGRLGTVAAQAVGATNGLVYNIAQRAANAVNKDTNIVSDVSAGRYGSAAGGAATSLLDRIPGLALLRRGLPQFMLADKIYNRLHKDVLAGESDEDTEKQAHADAEAAALRRNELGANPYRYKETLKAATERTMAAQAKAKKEAGWNTPIWHYEPGSGGSSVSGAADLNALAMSQIAGGGSDAQRPIHVGKIEVIVPGAPGMNAQDVAHATADVLITRLRGLPRAPSIRGR